MHVRSLPAVALTLLATFGAGSLVAAHGTSAAQQDDVRALDGEWLYVEDRTEGRPLEKHQPSMSTRFSLRVEEDAVVVVRGRGEVRIAFDGSVTEVADGPTLTHYSGAWEDGVFTYDAVFVRPSDGARTGVIVREMRLTDEGLLVDVAVDPPDGFHSVALYRHPADIPLPTPAAAVIEDLDWLAGAWVGERGTSSTEERWGPPLGGAMLGTSRTVRNGAMVGFEYLRVVERDGGLVYVAQPGGRPPTEFVLTALEGTRAVFENPRHDSPQRIVYELSGEERLTASIGFMKGGNPQRFEFEREDG